MATLGQSWKSETTLTACGLAGSSRPAAEPGLAGSEQTVQHQAAVFDHNLMLYRTAPSHHGAGSSAKTKEKISADSKWTG
jgi:hypothetical protein